MREAEGASRPNGCGIKGGGKGEWGPVLLPAEEVTVFCKPFLDAWV